MLTTRENEVLRLAAEGFSDKQIAKKLKISQRTVQTYISRACTKLGVRKRIRAIALYFRDNLNPENIA